MCLFCRFFLDSITALPYWEWSQSKCQLDIMQAINTTAKFQSNLFDLKLECELKQQQYQHWNKTECSGSGMLEVERSQCADAKGYRCTWEYWNFKIPPCVKTTNFFKVVEFYSLFYSLFLFSSAFYYFCRTHDKQQRHMKEIGYCRWWLTWVRNGGANETQE